MLLAFALFAHCAFATPEATISLHQLLDSGGQHHPHINLPQILYHSGGVLRISVDDDDDTASQIPPELGVFSNLRKQVLSSLCDCPTFQPSESFSKDKGNLSFEDALQSHPKDLQQILLPDGSIRRTLATATVGFNFQDQDESKEAHPLPLPDFLQSSCGIETQEAMEDLRDFVAGVVDVFVDKLDHDTTDAKMSYREILSMANHLEHFHIYTKTKERVGKDRLKEYSSTSTDYDSASGNSEEIGYVTSTSNPNGHNLHNHVKPEFPTLDYHTDAGFFLAFVPAMDCHTYATDDTSFYLKQQQHDDFAVGDSEDRQAYPIKFEENEIVILMGTAAQYWFPSNSESKHDDTKQQYPFIAASHALRLLPDAHRAWYGKMHLLPSTWTVGANDGAEIKEGFPAVKYGDVLPTLQLKNYKAHVPPAPVDGCGTTIFNSGGDVLERTGSSTTLSSSYLRNQRRRLQHVDSPALCNNETNFFCWYQCLEIPNSDHTMDYLQDGYSLYCLDPAILLSSDNSIPDATDPCEEGYVHNSNCMGSWQLPDENVPGYDFPYFDPSLIEDSGPVSEYHTELEEQYCYGGTSMYMDGFHWIGTTCVIYLFPEWVLSTPSKFAWANIGSIFFAILLEFTLFKRRSIYAMSPGKRRLILSALVYGIQLAMGYFIMLVIMTYSGPLFVSTIFGMMIGHCLFNAQDSLMRTLEKRKEVEKESELRATPLATTEHQNGTTGHDSNRISNDEESDYGGCCCEPSKPPQSANDVVVTEKTKLKDSVPEGATPCCQYTL